MVHSFGEAAIMAAEWPAAAWALRASRTDGSCSIHCRAETVGGRSGGVAWFSANTGKAQAIIAIPVHNFI
ncbi:Uncharacterised protein [Mycobacterium tuberculosis]|nr:Uncharacterised protein [Mycobacterium tuberculosis]